MAGWFGVYISQIKSGCGQEKRWRERKQETEFRAPVMGVDVEPLLAETWWGEGSSTGQRNPSCRGLLSTTHGDEKKADYSRQHFVFHYRIAHV